MQCTTCHASEAVTVYTELRDGTAVPHHLCASCFGAFTETLKAGMRERLSDRPLAEQQQAAEAVDRVMEAYRDGRLGLGA